MTEDGLKQAAKGFVRESVQSAWRATAVLLPVHRTVLPRLSDREISHGLQGVRHLCGCIVSAS